MKKRVFWSGIVLTGIVFSAGISTANNSFENSLMILKHEILFILMHTVLYFPKIRFVAAIQKNRFITLLLILWFASVTISFIRSPFLDSGFTLVMIRYIEPLVHILFSVYIGDLAKRVGFAKFWCFPAIPISCLIIIAIYIFQWNYGDYYRQHNSGIWMLNPPLNDNIRHTGYLVTAALAVALSFIPYGLYRFRVSVRLLGFVALSLLWSFLFWIGGRAAIISCISSCIFMFCSLRGHRSQRNAFVNLIITSGVLGILLAEYCSVFEWNGLFMSMVRTQASNPASTLDGLSTGRIRIWVSTLVSLKEHLFFGWGPQGYYFMPNRISCIHPHNLVLQFLIEWGVIGTVPFLVILTKLFIKGWRNHLADLKESPMLDRTITGSIIIALSVHGLLDGTYYHGQPSLYLALAFGFWVSSGAGNDRI